MAGEIKGPTARIGPFGEKHFNCFSNRNNPPVQVSHLNPSLGERPADVTEMIVDGVATLKVFLRVIVTGTLTFAWFNRR